MHRFVCICIYMHSGINKGNDDTQVSGSYITLNPKACAGYEKLSECTLNEAKMTICANRNWAKCLISK